MNNYVEIYRPAHPRARPNGCVWEHVLVAERMLGRPLKNYEVVHHMDENRAHNVPSNLMVFLSQRHHARYHRNKKNPLVKRMDGAYICLDTRYRVKPNYIKTWYDFRRKKIDWPPVEYLTARAEEIGYSALGRELGVSDNAIRKHIRTCGRA